jgi:hypothetical protein
MSSLVNESVRGAAHTSEEEYVAKFHPILQRALRLEANAEELLSFRAGAFPFWALMRLGLMIRLLDRVRGETSARDLYLKPRPVRFMQSLRYFATSLWRTPFRYVDKDIVFFCSGVNRRMEDGAYFNSRVDYFLDCLPQERVLLIEGADNLRYAWPRAVQPVAFKGGITALGAFYARTRRMEATVDAQVTSFMALLRRTFEDTLEESDYPLLEAYLRGAILRSRVYYPSATALLKRLKPRILLLENSHSGTDIELLIAARECGVVTVEYQHGAINPLCPYHNFHPRILRHGYARYLPDYFLSYGEFWNDLLTTSAQVVAIGNPHVETMRSRLPAATPRLGSIYFLSSANAPEIYIARLKEMVDAGFTVMFRPHPVERPVLRERYGDFFDQARISVDVSPDLYAQLGAHEFIVGDGRSTSLFEACAVAPGRVFVMEMTQHLTDVVPNHRFLKTIKSVAELRSNAHRGDDVPVDALFTPNWRERFSKFIADVLPECTAPR